jgi:hypothetical protein
MRARHKRKSHTVPPPEWLVARVRGEYVEMPGLRVTLAQACRLWQMDTATCQELLDHLVRSGFLSRTESGFYVASQDTRRRH